MKNKILALILLCFVLVGCAEEESPEFTPEPLIIDENKEAEENIIGYKKAVISLSGESTEPLCYEGAVFVDIQGDILIITGSDLVRSNFNEWY